MIFIFHLGLSHKLLAAESPSTTIQTGEIKTMEFSNARAYENLSISEVPELPAEPKKEVPFYFSYKKSLGGFIGAAYLVDAEETEAAFGIVYDKYLKDFSSYHFSLNIIDNNGRLDFGKKYINTFTKKLRYHYGFLGSLTFDSDKGLANFVNFKKALIGGMLGLERSYSSFSVRNDLKALIGRDESYLQLNLYLIYSW